jgi:hypothetical protein
VNPKEVELKYLITPDELATTLPPPLPKSWSYAHETPRRELLSDEYLDGDRAQLASFGLSLRRRVSDRVPEGHSNPVTTYWLKGREPAEAALHSRLEVQLSGLDDPALAAAISERGGVAPALHIQVLLSQERASWDLAHDSGAKATLSIDHVSGTLLGVALSWDELEVEIHGQEERATTLAAELDTALKALTFLTPNPLAKIDRARYLATQAKG